jgi:protein SCO1/2
MRVVRSVLLLALLLGLAGCGGSDDSPDDFAGTPLDGRTAPDFTLHDEDGREVSLSDFRGEPVFVTFVYTNCPDICPLIARNLAAAARSVPGAHVVAVSVDPKGDTPEAVRAFRKKHRLGDEFTYLLGSDAELARVWRDYAVYAAASAAPLVDHSALTMLLDADGNEQASYPPDVTAETAAHDLRLVLRR